MAYVLTRGAMQPWLGMGDATTAAQTVQVAGSAGAATATAILGSITANGGTILGLTATAVPVIGAALSAATMLVSSLVKNSGCGVTCVQTSSWANQAAAALQQVMDAYFSLPAPRTEAQKVVAIANFNTIWQQLKTACGQAGTGNAGVRCITDRQAGACVWKQKYAPTYPGQPEIGECWNWFNGYLAPIQQDVVVADAATSVTGALDSLLTEGTSSSAFLPLAIIGGLILLGVSL